MMKNKITMVLLLAVMLPWLACVKTYSTATDQSLTPQQPDRKSVV